jgi:uncharacterized protein YbjT (DUF2867 family)
MGTVLIAGATGNVGTHVVQELRRMGVFVRAFVRDPGTATAKLGAEVELAVGDFDNAASLRRAMRDVDRIFLASSDGPRKVEHEVAVIDAARAAGVRRIVKVSAIGAAPRSPLPPFDWNGRIEEQLWGSGVPAAVLRPNFYMTNILASAATIKRTDRLLAPAGTGKIGMIDPRDVAAAAARVLTHEGHEGRTYVLTGPEAITHVQIAEALSAATGRRIAFVDTPEDATRENMVATGLPAWLIDHLVKLFRLVREGALATVTGTVETLTGRRPRPFAEFAREHAVFFRD